MTISPNVQNALHHFNISGNLVKLEPLGQGNINDTFLGTWESGPGTMRHYVHQRLNTKVFRQPNVVMNNMRVVTEHIAHKRLGAEYRHWQRTHAMLGTQPLCSVHGHEELRVLHLISTRDGKDFTHDASGSVWRSTNYLEGLETHETVSSPLHAYQVGRCLGEFHNLVSDLDTNLLGDSLPGFHHTDKYFEKFKAAVESDAGKAMIARSEVVAALVLDLLARETYASRFADGMKDGSLSTRTVHNDPKISNFMFCPRSGAAVCMIDLDTVKPGLVHYDFGDCVRSAANKLGEETKDLDGVGIDLELFSAIANGYCSEAKAFLSEGERDLLVDSVKIIAFELSMRFLTSHLLSDGYFKERYEGNNLHRANVQFQLVRDVESKEETMREIVMEALKERAA